jgi:hypothetical protein
VTWTLGPLPAPDADTEEAASTLLRCTVQDSSPDAVGRAFSAAAVELALASYPGFTMAAPPGAGTPFGVYRAEYVDRSAVTHTVHHADGRTEVVGGGDGDWSQTPSNRPPDLAFVINGEWESVLPAPLGTFVHARSGDKGGDANLGVWVRNFQAWDWLKSTLTVDELRRLLPETRELAIERYELPNLGAVNFLIRGLLGTGATSTLRLDAQAKALGEWLRSRSIKVPRSLVKR